MNQEIYSLPIIYHTLNEHTNKTKSKFTIGWGKATTTNGSQRRRQLAAQQIRSVMDDRHTLLMTGTGLIASDEW